MSVKLCVKFQELERQSGGSGTKQTEVCRMKPSERQLHGERHQPVYRTFNLGHGQEGAAVLPLQGL